MGKNDVKYLFRSTCWEIAEQVLIETEFLKDNHMDNRDVRLLIKYQYDG